MSTGRGKAGERAAEKALKRRRMTLLERNVRAGGGEIDLVALDGDTIVFVEVKARAGKEFEAALEAVDRRKRLHVIQAARAFLSGKGLLDRPRRYDIAAVTLDAQERPVEVRWFPGAFDEGEYS